MVDADGQVLADVIDHIDAVIYAHDNTNIQFGSGYIDQADLEELIDDQIVRDAFKSAAVDFPKSHVEFNLETLAQKKWNLRNYYIEYLVNRMVDVDAITVKETQYGGEFFSLNNAAIQSYLKSFESPNAAIESFDDIGKIYLTKAFKRFEDFRFPATLFGSPSNEQEGEMLSEPETEEAKASARWAEIAQIEISQSNQSNFFDSVDGALTLLEDQKLDQATKSQARTLLIAAKDLAESPSPPSDIIWELVHRAGSICGILGLLLTLFLAGMN